MAEISLIRADWVPSSGGCRSRNLRHCSFDWRWLGVERESPRRCSGLHGVILSGRGRIRSRGLALLHEVRGGTSEVARMCPRAVSEDPCHEDYSRESNQRAPSRRFEYAVTGAAGFVLAGHELYSCTGFRAQNPSQGPGETWHSQCTKYRGQLELSSMVQEVPRFSTKVQVVPRARLVD